MPDEPPNALPRLTVGPGAPLATWVAVGGCDLHCPVCDCRDPPDPTDADGVPRAVRAGGERLVLRGEAAASPAFARILEATRAACWRDVWVQTHGARFVAPAAAAALRARGGRGVVVPLFAHASAVHDRVAGRPGALVTALRAMRACADAGLGVAVEVPLLPARLQDLEAVVRLAVRALPAVAGARFYVPARPPPALAPPPWDEARPTLARALAACREHAIPVEFRLADALPLCVAGHDPDLAGLYRIDPKRPVRQRDGFALAAPCAGCAVRAHCLGPSDAYRAAHGDRGLAPFATRPRALFEQQVRPRRVWLPHQRAAASAMQLHVLRPTLHCNQDCPFCSANETSQEVFRRPGDMLRRIARIARTGVQRLAFSGGEPTLARDDLPHYVRAAARLGVPAIELVTNGVLLDGPEKVRPLRDAGLTHAFVSLHAHDEDLSRRLTHKAGDWARTVRAIGALAAAGVHTDVNHVVTAENYPYLPRFADFVSDAWGGAVGISFAFVTPQYRALERLALVPRYREVVPYLRGAMAALVRRRTRFTVGSRQGVPPCLLGEYQGWSDVIALAANAHAEDEPQKVRGPQCDRCRYTRHCTGIWRHYAASHSFDELVPVPGTPFTETEIRAILEHPRPILAFDELPPPLRVPAPVADVSLPEVARPPARRRLALLPADGAQRELGVVLLGSGRQARRLARALADVPGLRLLGVASPHLLDRDPGPFAGLVLKADAAALLDATRPDAVVVAAATAAHHALALLAAARGLPVLVEKPLAQTQEQAEALVRAGERVVVMPAHALLFAPGVRALQALLQAPGGAAASRASATLRATALSPDAPASWSRGALFESLYHAVYLLGAATGGCEARVGRCEARGGGAPEWVRAELEFPGGVRGELELDFRAPGASTELAVGVAGGRALRWRRVGPDEELIHGTPSGDRTASVERGSETEAMLAAFRDAALGLRPVPVPTHDGRDAMATATALVDALDAHFHRPGAPRRVASPGLGDP